MGSIVHRNAQEIELVNFWIGHHLISQSSPLPHMNHYVIMLLHYLVTHI